MESIAQRQSHRDMTADGKVSKQQLSDMLWAAWGITHDGKRTVATAMNRQELSVYVVTPEGVSLYDAAANTLEKVSDADLRQLVGMQQFAIDCPLNILFVVDTTLQPDAGLYGRCRLAECVSVLRIRRTQDGVARQLCPRRIAKSIEFASQQAGAIHSDGRKVSKRLCASYR